MSYRLAHRPVKEEATEPQIPVLCLPSEGRFSPPHRTWEHSVVVVSILRAWYSEHLVSPYLHFQRNSSVTEAETSKYMAKYMKQRCVMFYLQYPPVAGNGVRRTANHRTQETVK